MVRYVVVVVVCSRPGEQLQPVRCFQEDVGVVDEALCDADTRPEDRHRRCKNMECPARCVEHTASCTRRDKALSFTSALSPPGGGWEDGSHARPRVAWTECGSVWFCVCGRRAERSGWCPLETVNSSPNPSWPSPATET